MADSVEAYRTDAIDGDSIGALFDPDEITEGIASRQSISPDLMTLLRGWSLGFCPLNAIERSLSDLIDTRVSNPVQRTAAVVTTEDAIAMLEPGSILIDCTGSGSLLRDHLTPSPDELVGGANTLKVRLEYALVITFLYGQPYDCNEYCKYYKNIENAHYKFIPMVNRTHYDGSVSHVTGIVNISAEEYEAMPPRFDGAWLRSNFSDAAASMDRFIEKIQQETHGEVIGDLDVVRIPLDLYRARNATSRRWLTSRGIDSPFASFRRCSSRATQPSARRTFSRSHWDSSVRRTRRDSLRGPTSRSGEASTGTPYMYKQWLRVYMRSKMIKHNKDLFESLDEPFALFEKLHIY